MGNPISSKMTVKAAVPLRTMKIITIKRILIALFITLLSLPVIICVTGFLFGPSLSKMILKSFILINSTPMEKGLGGILRPYCQITNFYLKTDDNHQIGCLLIEPKEISPSHKAIVLLHGNGCNRLNCINNLDLTHLSMNFVVLVPDVRSFGDSEGEFSVEGVNLDIKACVSFLNKRFQRDVTVVGFSLGGGMALEYSRFQSRFYRNSPSRTSVEESTPNANMTEDSTNASLITQVNRLADHDDTVSALQATTEPNSSHQLVMSPDDAGSEGPSPKIIDIDSETNPDDKVNSDKDKLFLGMLVHTDIDRASVDAIECIDTALPDDSRQKNSDFREIPQDLARPPIMPDDSENVTNHEYKTADTLTSLKKGRNNHSEYRKDESLTNLSPSGSSKIVPLTHGEARNNSSFDPTLATETDSAVKDGILEYGTSQSNEDDTQLKQGSNVDQNCVVENTHNANPTDFSNNTTQSNSHSIENNDSTTDLGQMPEKSDDQFYAHKFVILASFSSLLEICNDFWIFRVGKYIIRGLEECVDFWDSKDNIRSCRKGGVIIIHSLNDQLVSIKHGKALSHASNTSLCVLQDYGHVETLRARETWKRVIQFCVEE